MSSNEETCLCLQPAFGSNRQASIANKLRRNTTCSSHNSSNQRGEVGFEGMEPYPKERMCEDDDTNTNVFDT